MKLEIRTEATTDAVRAEVAAAFDATPFQRAKTDTSGGRVDAVECLNGAVFYRVLEDGKPAAFFVVRVDEGNGRKEARITLAHGRAGFDLVAVVLPIIEALFSWCDAVSLQTRRRGLMKKLHAAGYATAAVTLRKDLK
ncbi:hypothetical protein [Trinickia symbiotica]|uniref:N-acetyltransferase n=1 Tax=Trinickia symbiotica TaxID=863227 RepID=A0A2N7XAJ0_9BURK|nr:hypothetical protein [Trinickia symbiotica]PMS38475.1 hypothetical protein C0Z20_00900 [Trinickia symbiotica]